MIRSSSIAALGLLLCSCSTPPLATPTPLQPLVTLACPPLPPLLDDSFGAWVTWATAAAAQYEECRAAKLGR